MLMDDLKIEYRPSNLGGLEVVPGEAPATSNPYRTAVKPQPMIRVDGETIRASGRFWSSLFHRFGLSGNVFRYFDYDEVFERVVATCPDDRLRLCIERPEGKAARLLAVSNPKRGLLGFGDAADMVRDHGGHELKYHDGTLISRHTPHSGNFGFDIGGDRFHNRFVCEIPVDGFGQPRLYLSLLRQVCSNGAVGYSRSFRSDIRLGNDAHHTLARALGQFDSDEGFAAIRQRFESAQRSWASVREVLELRRSLVKCRRTGETAPFIHTLDRVAGDLHGLYGVANLDNLSVKRQRILPARCRVYDLINLASEIATHKTDAAGALSLQAYIGTLISEEFDLEGTAEKVPDFQDLFLNLN